MASDDDGAMASDGVFDIDIAGDMAGADAATLPQFYRTQPDPWRPVPMRR